MKRFWSKVDIRGPRECWNWTAGCQRRGGAGQFGLRAGKVVLAHRWAYELTRGPIPPGLEVRHTCFNVLCCNPYHLKLMTPNRRHKPLKTHCPQGHEYSPENTMVQVKGKQMYLSRKCRTCDNERQRRKYQADKAQREEAA